MNGCLLMYDLVSLISATRASKKQMNDPYALRRRQFHSRMTFKQTTSYVRDERLQSFIGRNS